MPGSRWLDGARRRRAWLLLAAALLASVSWLLAGDRLARIDRLLQESALNLVRPAAAADIVIVAVDDRSLESIGRWPWRRALHARLVEQIAAGRPRCIGLDLLLDDANAQFPADDAMLAASMRRAGCVVLPMAMQVPSRNSQLQSEVLPTTELARAATALGHSHLSVDADSVVEGMYLLEGFPGREWPHFSLALRDAAQGRLAPQPSIEGGPRSSPPEGRWIRRHQELILYDTPSSSFLTVPYIDVLNGKVPPETFRDRYVLVGATADSVADLFAVAAPTQNGLLPGVEIFATVLQSLDRHTHIHAASPWQDFAYNLAPLAIALLGLLWLGPLGAFSLIAGLLLAMGALQVAQPWTGIRFSVAPGLGGLLAVYPLWSLLWLSTAYRFLRRGTRELNAVLEGLPRPNDPAPSSDFADREMMATATAMQRMRDLHRFVRDAMDQMPDTTLVLDRQGRVFHANRRAARHWQRDAAELVGLPAHELLGDLRAPRDGQPMLMPGALDPAHPAPIAGEAEDAAGRILLLRCVPFLNADNVHAGWMVALVDTTKMRRTQGQRDEALRFISHDIREPSASILTVVELARANPALLPRDLLLERIERHAHTGLELADGFVELARAEAQPFHAELLDLVELATQAVDNAWAFGRRKQVRLRLATALEEAPCIGDRGLLARALANVVGNGLKYSPPGSELLCEVTERGAHWCVAIRDQGPGIAAELQSQLFQPFHRLHRESHPEVHGVGLGLLLVRTTLQRHGGSVEIESAQNAGCTFILVLPKPAAATLQSLANAELHQTP